MLFLEKVLKRGRNHLIGSLENYGSSNSDEPRHRFRFGQPLEGMACNLVCDNDGALLLVRAIAEQAVAFHHVVFANYGKPAERARKREAAKWLVRLAEQLIKEAAE